MTNNVIDTLEALLAVLKEDQEVKEETNMDKLVDDIKVDSTVYISFKVVDEIKALKAISKIQAKQILYNIGVKNDA